MQALKETNFQLPYHTSLYRGKVRDVYTIEERLMVIVATDRISAFDVILPRPIPYKGQTLNQTAAFFLSQTNHICPNHFISMPDPNVTIGIKCEAFPVEVIVRGYLCGHAWRVYSGGGREICGVKLPDGLRQNDRLPAPIITPSTKSKIGHDMDISEYEITKSGLVAPDEWEQIRHYALALYSYGAEKAEKNGLLLADTKYEFGLKDFNVYLIDEVHTPDSSRYLIADGYEERQAKGQQQKQLSKEFVREWLLVHEFDGQEGQEVPEMTDAFVEEVGERYIEVYETITAQTFVRRNTDNLAQEIEQNILEELKRLNF